VRSLGPRSACCCCWLSAPVQKSFWSRSRVFSCYSSAVVTLVRRMPVVTVVRIVPVVTVVRIVTVVALPLVLGIRHRSRAQTIFPCITIQFSTQRLREPGLRRDLMSWLDPMRLSRFGTFPRMILQVKIKLQGMMMVVLQKGGCEVFWGASKLSISEHLMGRFT
jgi:hypothetical protein